MTDCDDLIDDFHRQSREQVDLALIAAAPPVVAMHIDLAVFSEEQARLAEDICDDQPPRSPSVASTASSRSTSSAVL